MTPQNEVSSFGFKPTQYNKYGYYSFGFPFNPPGAISLTGVSWHRYGADGNLNAHAKRRLKRPDAKSTQTPRRDCYAVPRDPASHFFTADGSREADHSGLCFAFEHGNHSAITFVWSHGRLHGPPSQARKREVDWSIQLRGWTTCHTHQVVWLLWFILPRDARTEQVFAH